MRSRAHFGTSFTPIVPPSCCTCNPCGQFCMPARANPFRHTSHADRARKGARPTALVGKSACGAQSISAHPSRGSCTKGKSTYAPSVGFRQFRRTPHTAHTPKGVPPTASVGKLACVHVQIFVHLSHGLRLTSTSQSQWGSSSPLRRTPRTDRAHRFHLLSQWDSSRGVPSPCRHTPHPDRAPPGAPPTAPVGEFACGPA